MSRKIVIQALSSYQPPDDPGPSDMRHVGHVSPPKCAAPLFPVPSSLSSQRPLANRNDISRPIPGPDITQSMLLQRVSGLRVCNESDLVTRQCVTPISSSSSPALTVDNEGGSGGEASSGVGRKGDVWAPIPQSQEVMVEPGYEGYVMNNRVNKSHSQEVMVEPGYEGYVMNNRVNKSHSQQVPPFSSYELQKPSEPPHHKGQVVGEVDPDATLSADEEYDIDPYSDHFQDKTVSEQLDDEEPIPAIDGSRKRKKKKPTKKEEMAEKISNALEAWKANEFGSVKACAQHFGVPRSTLTYMIKEKKDKWRGRGKTSAVFSDEEEKLIKDNIIERCELGVGLTIEEVWSAKFEFI